MKELVRLAGIPRSTYYFYVKQMDRIDPDADLKVEIKAIMMNTKVVMDIAVFVMN